MDDVAIVGGGIVGLATGLALQRSGRARAVVLEKERVPGTHQTGHNSGVIHSGLYYRPGSLKARLCVEGRQALIAFCGARGVPFELCGKVVVATRPEQLGQLDVLEERARANGLEGVRRLGPEQLREIEPHAAGLAALRVPQTGIVDYGRVAVAMARALVEEGGEVRTGARALAVVRRGGEVTVETSAGAVTARLLLNCAGLHSDRVAALCGLEPGVRIVPFRGEYFTLVPSRAHLVRHLIYPVPDPAFPFLGVHFTRMAKGGVEAGPNAVLSLQREAWGHGGLDLRDAWDAATWPGLWKVARKHWRSGLGELYRSLSRRAFATALQALVPDLREEDLEEGGAGTRAQAVDREGRLLDDFHLLEAPGMVHVLNAPSPAATASLAIGREIAARALAQLGAGTAASA